MRLGTADVLIRAKTDKFNKEVDQSEKKVKGFAQNSSKAVSGLSKSFVSLAGAAGIGMLAKSFLATGIAAERMSRGLEAALGSTIEAAKAQKFLREEAERLGLVFEDQISDFQKIAAAARGTVLEGRAVRDIYTSIVEASTALQLSADETSGALNAIGQMISKGNVQAEELRGQLGERLPGAFQIAAKAMGATTSELGKMLEQGQVVATDFLPKFARALSARYEGSVAGASKTAQAEINRLSNAYFEMKKVFVETGALTAFTAGVKAASVSVKFLGDQIKLVSDYWIDFFTTTKVEAIKEKIKELEDELRNFKGFGAGERFEKQSERFAAQKIKEIRELREELSALQKVTEKEPVADKRLALVDTKKIEDAERMLELKQLDMEVTREFKIIEAELAAEQIATMERRERARKSEQESIARWLAEMAEIAEAENKRMAESAMSWIDGAKTGLDDYAESATDIVGNMENAVSGAFKGMEDALVDFCMTGKMNFADFANAIIKDMIRIFIQSQITGIFAQGLSTWLGGQTAIAPGGSGGGPASSGDTIAVSAQGNIYDSPDLSKHSNSIIDSPALFNFAHGQGLMGEAGPEAIMPLTRMPGGDLGVKTESNDGSSKGIEVHIHEAPGTQARMEQSGDDNGGVRLDIIIEQIEQAVTGRMDRGAGLAPFMDSRYARTY